MKSSSIIALAFMAILIASCGPESATEKAHLHVASPPHGGTPVALGDEYQIEWVLDAPAGKLQAYIFDGEMENFVRIDPASFDLNVKLPDRREVLRMAAIANQATGENVGSTSLFEAGADWLKTNKTFDCVLPEINVKGTVYTNISFSFPK